VAELKARGLSDEAVAMYQQSRLAIDHSLDSLLAMRIGNSNALFLEMVPWQCS